MLRCAPARFDAQGQCTGEAPGHAEAVHDLEFGDGVIRVWKDAAPVATFSRSVAGLTQASPARVTAFGHGLVNGDRVLVTGVRGMRWSAITHSASSSPAMRDDMVMQRITADPTFVNEMTARMHPGMTMVLTDAPLTPDTRTGKDFVIVSSN